MAMRAQKMVPLDWCKEMLEKYNGVALKDVYKIVTGDKSWTYAYESETNTNQIQRKLFVEKVSSSKLVMLRLFHFSNVARSVRSGTPQFL